MIMSRDEFKTYLVELIVGEVGIILGGFSSRGVRVMAGDIADKIIETLETNDVRISSSQ
jgi:hypothetical protein